MHTHVRLKILIVFISWCECCQGPITPDNQIPQTDRILQMFLRLGSHIADRLIEPGITQQQFKRGLSSAMTSEPNTTAGSWIPQFRAFAFLDTDNLTNSIDQYKSNSTPLKSNDPTSMLSDVELSNPLKKIAGVKVPPIPYLGLSAR